MTLLNRSGKSNAGADGLSTMHREKQESVLFSDVAKSHVGAVFPESCDHSWAKCLVLSGNN